MNVNVSVNQPDPDPDKASEYLEAIDARIGDFLDGYAVVGFMRGSDRPVTVVVVNGDKTALALKSLLINSINHVPVGQQHG